MINFDASNIRQTTKMLFPTADFDSPLTFYYDETNNIRKFYVRKNKFNYSFDTNFVLGGLVYEGTQPEIKALFDKLDLQKNIKEVKLKHIAKGEFIDCLKSERLNIFLKYILHSNIYVHYLSLNLIYWSIVDIIDSAIVNSELEIQLSLNFFNRLKNDLYKLVKLEIETVLELFYTFEYPNLKQESILEFIVKLSSIFNKYIETEEFHFGLECLRQILKESKKNKSLPFLMDNKDHVLIDNFSGFYLRPIYLFKNSNHIFDNEQTILEILDNLKIINRNEEIINYSFVDSQSELFVQASDIFVGLMGKLTNYINSHSNDKIANDFSSLSERQLSNIDLLLELIGKSHNKNIAFLHSIDSYEELAKMKLICKIRNKNF